MRAAAGHAPEVCKPESGVMAVCVYIKLVMGKGCWGLQHLLCFGRGGGRKEAKDCRMCNGCL
jgi:hypothetical protein